MTWRVLFAAVVLSGCASQSNAKALDGLLSFSDASICAVGPGFERLMASAIEWKEYPAPNDGHEIYEGRVGSLKIPRQFAAQFGEPRLEVTRRIYPGFAQDTHTVTIPAKGLWHGMQLSSLEVVGLEGKVSGFRMVFAEPADAVLAAANGAGFQLPENGSALRNAEIAGVQISVGPRGDGASLSCLSAMSADS